MKKCKDCGESKELNEFHKEKNWYRNRCKKCHNLKYQPPTGKINTGRFKKGNIPTHGFKKGSIPFNKGKHCSPEMKEHLRNLQKGRKQSPEEIEKRRLKLIESRRKDRKNGRSCIRYREFCSEVKKRDEYKCKYCNSEKRLHIHHLIPWSENENLRFELSNVITLCNSCHMKIERKGKSSWAKGKKFTEEHKDKLRKAKIGFIPWNKGLKIKKEDKWRQITQPIHQIQ